MAVPISQQAVVVSAIDEGVTIGWCRVGRQAVGWRTR